MPRLVPSLSAALTVSAFLAIGAGGCSPTGEARSEAAPANKRSRKATLVETAKVRPGELSDRWSFLGNVRALMQADLAAGAEGETRAVLVREGDKVTKGQLLLQVDARVVRARLAAARAQVKEAKEQKAQAARELARFSRLSKEARSELELERAASAARLAEARVAVLKAQVAQVGAELAQHRVVAPFAGVVSKRLVDPGDWLKRGQQALALVSSDALEILVDVAPGLLRYVSMGDKATVTVAAGGTISATVKGVVGALDPVARTARIRLAPDGKAASKKTGVLRAGAAVTVAFSIRRRGVGVVVPRDALLNGPVATRVITVRGGKAVPVTVSVLATAKGSALVQVQGKATLSVGAAVVTRGNERLRPGQALRVAKP